MEQQTRIPSPGYRIDHAGRLVRSRILTRPEDPDYVRAMTMQYRELYKKHFGDRDKSKLLFKELSTKLKREGIRHNYQKIKGVIRIYWEGEYTNLYIRPSGYFKITRHNWWNSPDYYFAADTVQEIAEKIWRFRLMNFKFYKALVK